MQLMIFIDRLVALVSWRQLISLLTNSKEVDKHPTVNKFRALIETIDLAIVLRNSSERYDVVKIHGQNRSTTTKRLQDRLIVFDSLVVVAASSDNDVSTTGEKSLDNSSPY